MNTSEKLDGTTVLKSSNNVVGCEVEGEMVLLDLQSGTYFGLNPVGAEIWGQITQGKSLNEIQQYLLSRYDVGAELCQTEVFALVSKLTERGLVRNGNDEAA